MITELTPEQEARLPEFRDKWIKIGLSTEPANRPEAERGIRLAYECGGLKPPKEIVSCDSPFDMVKMSCSNQPIRRFDYIWLDVISIVNKQACSRITAHSWDRIMRQLWRKVNPWFWRVASPIINGIQEQVDNDTWATRFGQPRGL